jgi:hypothetical protein
MLSKDRQMKIYELEDRKRRDNHVRMVKFVSTTGKSAIFIGPNRMKEIVGIIKSRLPYKRGHILLFLNNGNITREECIDNCIYKCFKYEY